MSQRAVTITVDGKTISIEPGTYSFNDMKGAFGSPATTRQFTVVPATKATTINGNDSYQIGGGETFTSVHP